MVTVRAAMLASVVLLVGATLSGTSAEDSWNDIVQEDTGTKDQTSSETPSWEAGKNGGDDQSSGDDKSGGDDKNGGDDVVEQNDGGDKNGGDDKNEGDYWNGGGDKNGGGEVGGDDKNGDDGAEVVDQNEDKKGREDKNGGGGGKHGVDIKKSSRGGGGSSPSSGGCKVPDGTWPTSTGTVQFKEAKVIKAGEDFDGKMQTFERSDVTCEGQKESGSKTAVFLVEPGGTLRNAIIGKNQMEGVHCDKHDCVIDNVWWDDVCEDALSIKGGTASSVSSVIGGGARQADDKVIQHNGLGTVKIDGFYGEDISKLYRSCGTCGDKARKVEVSNVYIVNMKNAVVTVNKNWNDEATLSNIWVKSTKDKVKICQWSQGNADGEPSTLGDGPSPPLCQYSESDVHINEDVSKATGGTSKPSKGSSSDVSSGSENADQGPAVVSPAGGEGDDSKSKGEDDESKDKDEDKEGGEKEDKKDKDKEKKKDDDKDDKKDKDKEDDDKEDKKGREDKNGGGGGKHGVDIKKSSRGGGGSSPSSGGGKVPDGTWPTSTGTVQFKEAKVIKAGEDFDGKMQTFERSDVTCEGQKESGSKTAVFLVEPGGTLRNAIIGKNQMEGVHCDKHDCVIDNVWWDDVCEDALSIKGGTASSVSSVIGGGARQADDKVIQHNGLGTVKIDGFYGEDISKLYRSCGTCGDKARKVEVSNVYIVNMKNAVVTVNKNWNDEATLSNIWVKSTKDKVKICQWSQGNADGEPSTLGDGPSPPLCQYSESDVHINEDVSKATGGTSKPSKGSSSDVSSGSENADQGPAVVSPAGGEGDDSKSKGEDDESKDKDEDKEGGEKEDKKDKDKEKKKDDDKDDKKDKDKEDDDKEDKKDDDKEDKEDDDEEDKEEKKDEGHEESFPPVEDSVMQEEVAGEAKAWNGTVGGFSLEDKSESSTKISPPASASKCNVRRKRN